MNGAGTKLTDDLVTAEWLAEKRCELETMIDALDSQGFDSAADQLRQALALIRLN